MTVFILKMLHGVQCNSTANVSGIIDTIIIESIKPTEILQLPQTTANIYNPRYSDAATTVRAPQPNANHVNPKSVAGIVVGLLILVILVTSAVNVLAVMVYRVKRRARKGKKAMKISMVKLMENVIWFARFFCYHGLCIIIQSPQEPKKHNIVYSVCIMRINIIMYTVILLPFCPMQITHQIIHSFLMLYN